MQTAVGHANVKSFVLAVYDTSLKQLVRYALPVTVVGPMGNRIIRELLGGSQLREPWYTLAARSDATFARSPLPIGPTSLSSQSYDPSREPGPKVVLHPTARIRGFEVRLFDFQTEVYRGVYSIDDMFLHSAYHAVRNGLAKGVLPNDRGLFYYTVNPEASVVHDVSPGLLPDEAYQVDGVFRLPPPAANEPGILFRPVPQPPLPERDPTEFGPVRMHGKGAPQAGRILLPADLFADLASKLTFHRDNEEGGYLLGSVYRQPGSPPEETSPDFRWIVECTELIRADAAVGSPNRLLFTGEAWSSLTRRRDKAYAGRKLVGWFHTHVFPATDDFGLSGLDHNMHGLYLRKPWQFALLVNLETGKDRTLRCYQYNAQKELVEAPFEVYERKP